jgi:hypothetical protein
MHHITAGFSLATADLHTPLSNYNGYPYAGLLSQIKRFPVVPEWSTFRCSPQSYTPELAHKD